uniref:ACD-sHsps-like protein n=1 Tax=Tamarix hispida TaxID=189793 RepID=K4NPF2_9CARY|nr:ACD-sHsps-like protein [Tamarix hispida]
MAITASNYSLCAPNISSSSKKFINPTITRQPKLNLAHVNMIKARAREEPNKSLDVEKVSQQRAQPNRWVARTAASPLGLWDRFPAARTVQQMMDTMDSLMEDPFAYSSPSALSVPVNDNDGEYGRRRRRTPWAIKERKEDYKIRFDMPGMNKDDVKVWVEEGKMLVVKAEKGTGRKGQDDGGVRQHVENDDEEWPPQSYGKYNNRIALPDNVEAEKIRAEVKDGVLYITIPKVDATSKIIDISVQ